MNAISTRRKPVNLSLDAKLVEEARALGVNISRACQAGLAEEVISKRNREWLTANAAAIESSNAYVERHGLPFAKHRMF